jgi:hypothetical protein
LVSPGSAGVCSAGLTLRFSFLFTLAKAEGGVRLLRQLKFPAAGIPPSTVDVLYILTSFLAGKSL